MPTTYKSKGTANTEPPPPIKPRLNPTITPEKRERKMMIGSDYLNWHLLHTCLDQSPNQESPNLPIPIPLCLLQLSCGNSLVVDE